MYPPWMMPYPFPWPGAQQTNEDPFKTMKKWKRFLKSEEDSDKKKEKEKEKKHEPWDQVSQVANVLMISMLIVGPSVYLVFHLLSTH